MITERDAYLIAKAFATIIKNDDDLAKRLASIMKKEPKKKLVSAKIAADTLGISVWQLYRIKDDEDGRPRFSYSKGSSQSSPLKFNAVTLIEEYERFLSTKRQINSHINI